MRQEDKIQGYLNTFVKTSLFVFFTLVLSKVLTYLYKIVIARSFGAATYGNFSLAMIITGLFVAFASLGLSDGLVRYISHYLGKKDSPRIKYFVSISASIMLVSGIIGGALLFFLAEPIAVGIFGESQLTLFLRAFSLVVPLSLLANIFVSMLKSYERAKTVSFLMGVFQNGIRLLVIVCLIAVGYGLSSLISSYVLSYLLLLIAAIYLSRKQIASISKARTLDNREKTNLLKDLFSYSWPLLFVGILFSMFYWTDSLVLGYFTNAEIVGLYNAAISIVGLFVIAPDLFSHLFLPIVSKELSRNNKTIIRDLTKQITKWIYVLNIPCLTFIFIFPEAFLNLFFGPEFIVAQGPLRVLALGGIFSGFINTFTNLLSAKKETKLILHNFVIFSILNLVLDVLLIRYEMVGIATATSISWIGFCLTLFFEIKHKYGFYPIKRALIKIGLVALLPVALTYAIAQTFGQTILAMVVAGFLFVIIYGGLLILTKAFDEKDWSIVRSIKSKIISKTSYFSS